MYTKSDFPHPEFDYPTTKGIDLVEALFDMYAAGKYKINDENVLTSGGWCKLHESFGESPFRKTDWRAILDKHPTLWELPYQHLAKQAEEKEDE